MAIIGNPVVLGINRKIPEFTYTGDYEVGADSGGWTIKFLTSGTLTFTKLNSAANGIDVFMVGGGGGGSGGDSGQPSHSGSGGGGGYTKTEFKVMPLTGINYNIVIGAGGAGGTASHDGSDGEQTTAFDSAAYGGKGGIYSSSIGGAGGSGGGAGVQVSGGTGGNGADNGHDGYEASDNIIGGIGQHSNTRAFGEAKQLLYAGGGGGGSGWSTGIPGNGGIGGGTGGTQSARIGIAGTTNTGGGGGGGGAGWSGQASGGAGGAGGSGIVIIRNHHVATQPTLNNTDALLKVTAHSEAIVTVSRNGSIKNSFGYTIFNNEAMQEYYFIISENEFDSTNPWVITATQSGYDTITRNIIIDQAYVYDVPISRRIYLVKDGQLIGGDLIAVGKKTSESASTTQEIAPTVTYNTDNITIGYSAKTSTNTAYIGITYFPSKIDVTLFNKLWVQGTTRNNSNSDINSGINGWTSINTYQDDDRVFKTITQSEYNSTTVFNMNLEIDISNIMGEIYIGTNSVANSTGWTSIQLMNVYLEI